MSEFPLLDGTRDLAFQPIALQSEGLYHIVREAPKWPVEILGRPAVLYETMKSLREV
jgi:hypothetical protein